MTMTTMNPDKTKHINDFIDRLFTYYAAKWLDPNQAPIYKESIMGVYSLLEQSEINEIQKRIFQEHKYIPKIMDLKNYYNQYAKRRPERVQNVNKQPQVHPKGVNVYNYKEEDFTKACQLAFKNMCLVYTEESVKEFFKVHDMMFKGFQKDDIDFFSNRLVNASKIPESYDIIKMLTYIKLNRVNPRIDKLRGREQLPNEMDKQDVISYSKAARLLLNNQGPKLVAK